MFFLILLNIEVLNHFKLTRSLIEMLVHINTKLFSNIKTVSMSFFRRTVTSAKMSNIRGMPNQSYIQAKGG